MTPEPFVSVVVPCRNEASHIHRVLKSVIRTAYPKDRLEVTFVDGLSTDGTRQILERAARLHPFIRVIDNPKLITPCGMNIGIRQSRGEVIVRMDAHSQFPSDYIERCLKALRETGAACAGGRSVNVPNGEGLWARAVAVVTKHPLGVGDSTYRVGGSRGFVDTVPFGVFPREVLENVGLFDERLTRNQDNELTARLIRHGYKIAFDPTIRVRYWNQGTLEGLMKQGFYTGMWNVYTLYLYPYTWKTSRFVPAGFAAYLAALPAFTAARPGWAWAAALPLALYCLLVAGVSAAAGPAGGGVRRVATTFAAYHLSYGFGTLWGALNLAIGRWRGHLGRPLKT